MLNFKVLPFPIEVILVYIRWYLSIFAELQAHRRADGRVRSIRRSFDY